MKTKILRVLGGCCLVFGLLAAITLAQEEPQVQRYLVYECFSSAENIEAFEAAMLKEVALFSKFDLPVGWTAYSTADHRYFFLFPIEDSGSIDKINAAFAVAAEKAGEEYKEMQEAFLGTYDHISTSIIAFHPELSYVPEDPRVPPEEAGFFYWNFFYVKPGLEGKFQELAKKFAKLCEGRNVADAYNFIVSEFGRDLPVMLATSWSREEADFEPNNEKMWEALGEEGQALWLQGQELCRKVEETSGRIRPELSLILK
jgi:hypothetical protein